MDNSLSTEATDWREGRRFLRQSLQKPQRRAEQRDEEAIEHCKEEKWSSLKKGR
jgi:hypothetical protein